LRPKGLAESITLKDFGENMPSLDQLGNFQQIVSTLSKNDVSGVVCSGNSEANFLGIYALK
jgi:hypothetical protein